MFMCGQKVLQKVLKLLISISGLALWRGKAQTEAECSLCRLLFVKKRGRKGPLGRERDEQEGVACASQGNTGKGPGSRDYRGRRK